MPRHTPTPNTPSDSELVLHKASELTVIQTIQRIPTDARLRQMARQWDSSKEGILFVAEITDGEHAGVLHVYDGGTRWKAMLEFALNDEGVPVGDPEYVFVCWVRRMTEQEAADAFISFNTEAKRPSPYFQYQVGLIARTPWCVAIESGLAANHAIVGQSASANRLAAVGSAKAIVEAAARYAETVGHSDPWVFAAEQLAEVIRITRLAYTDGGAYDNNVMRAVSEILALNLRHGVAVDTARLAEKVGSKTPEQWHTEGLALSRVSSAGSSHRGTLVRYQMVALYNTRIGAARRILGAMVVTDDAA
jgi:hypothetical protein